MKSGLPASQVRSAQAQKRFRAKASGSDSAVARVEIPASRSPDDVAADATSPATDQNSGPQSHLSLPAAPPRPSTASDFAPPTNKPEDSSVADAIVNIAELKRKSIQELQD